MEETKYLLKKVLTAQVLLLSKQLNAEKQAKGTTRIGGDYTKEAATLIKQKVSQVVQLLQ